MFAMKFLINKTPLSDKQNPIVVLLKSSNPSVSFTLCKHYEKDKRKIDNANTHVGWP